MRPANSSANMATAPGIQIIPKSIRIDDHDYAVKIFRCVFSPEPDLPPPRAHVRRQAIYGVCECFLGLAWLDPKARGNLFIVRVFVLDGEIDIAFQDAHSPDGSLGAPTTPPL